MKNAKRQILVFFFFFIFIPHTAFGQSPLEAVKEKVDMIISIIVDAKKNQTINTQTTEDELWKQIDAIFDFEIFSQRALGKNWLAMDDTMRREFISLFRKLLGRSYLKKITSYENETIKYLRDLSPSPEIADVFTTIESNGQEYSLNYRLIVKNGSWKIYDITIEGSSLLSNYRSQFNEFLKKNTSQDLLINLRNKVERKHELTK